MDKHDDARSISLPWGRGSGKAALSQDPFFKEVFKDKDFICSLLTELLAIPSLRCLDFSKMELMSSNFVKDSKSDLGFLEQAMHWGVDCQKLEEFKKKLKDHDKQMSAV